MRFADHHIYTGSHFLHNYYKNNVCGTYLYQYSYIYTHLVCLHFNKCDITSTSVCTFSQCQRVAAVWYMTYVTLTFCRRWNEMRTIHTVRHGQGSLVPWYGYVSDLRKTYLSARFIQPYIHIPLSFVVVLQRVSTDDRSKYTVL